MSTDNRISKTEELNEIASRYHLNHDVADKFIEDIFQHYCCDWISTLLAPDDHVVELGYGEGITLSRLSPHVARYTMVEGAKSLVDIVRNLHPEVEVEHNLFEEYLPSECCDKLLALHVFEHVDNPVHLAKHLRSWLKPNGEIIVVVPNRNSLHRQLAVIMGLQPELDSLSPRDHLVGHQRVYDIEAIETDLSCAGFEILDRKGFFLKVLPNSMMLEHSPDLIGALNTIGDRLPAHMGANIAIHARVKR